MSLAKVNNQSLSLLSTDNFEHTFRIANMMAKSEMVPKGYQGKPQDIMIAMEMGFSMGMGALQAVQNIAVINGKPCLYGDGMLAVCAGRSDFEDIKEEPMKDTEGKVYGYRCTIKRKDRSPKVHEFTIEQAQAAGLWGKSGPWKQYPERMLQMRARAFALRDSFADALGGVRMAEEVQDYDIIDVTPKNEEESEKSIQDLIKNKEKSTVTVDKETGEVLEG